MGNGKGSFEQKAAQISRRDQVSLDRGEAILASGARKASAAAQQKNPNLLKVSGVKKKY